MKATSGNFFTLLLKKKPQRNLKDWPISDSFDIFISAAEYDSILLYYFRFKRFYRLPFFFFTFQLLFDYLVSVSSHKNLA